MYNTFKKYYFILFLSFFSNSLFSQVNNQKNQQLFGHLYNFEFKAADSVISTIDSLQSPDLYNFLKSHFMRWYHLPIHQQKEEILQQYNNYLNATEKKETELDYRFINSALLRAEFNYNQGNYYKAYQNGSKIYDLVKDNLEVAPEREELLFLSGLYHYYYQYYKSENPIYASMMWLFKEGDRETGLQWLKIVAKGESIANTEALIYLSHIYLRLENEPDSALKYSIQLHQRYPDNFKFFEVLLESQLIKNVHYEASFNMIQKLLNSDKIYFKKYGFCYEALYQLRGSEMALDKKVLKLKKALRFIEQNGGGNHLSSLLYQGLHQATAQEEFLRQKDKHEVYKFALTGYPQK